MIGKTLSHYRILEKLGAGGMGVVYLAHDERLERNVAVKILQPHSLADEGARKQFRREALVLSKLSHPHIGTIHDFDSQDGLDFLVMEYVPGTTLADRLASGPMEEAEVRRLAGQIADALDAAHEKGVIHRDLKPGNIIVTPKGQVKVLDFGLARRFPSAGTLATFTTVSAVHEMAGTLPYMAPEQLLGKQVDIGTDIYGFGVVLYEMATGKRPFHEENPVALTNAILNSPPPPPSSFRPELSRAMDSTVLRCLEKNSKDRFASARAVVDSFNADAPTAPLGRIGKPRREGFRRWAVRTVAAVAIIAAGVFAALRVPQWVRAMGAIGQEPVRTLAVLPFRNATGDSMQQYFVDGVVDEVTADLSQIGALGVISNSSSRQFRDSKQTIPEIGKALAVDALVTGSTTRAGNRVRVDVALLSTGSGKRLWNARFDRPSGEAPLLAGEIAGAIANEARVKLAGDEESRIHKSRKVEPAAHEEYLKGRFFAGDWISEEGHRKSLEHYNSAIRIDPGYAPAWAGLAEAYWSLSNIYMPSKEAMPKARAAAERALELDGDLPEAHGALGVIRSQYDWEWSSAEWEIRRAIQLKPSYATAHFYYAQLLTETGRVPEAETEFKRARELEPLTTGLAGWEAMGHYYAGQYDQAIAGFRALSAAEPTYVTWHYSLGLCYAETGAHDQALAEFRKAMQNADNPGVKALLGYGYAAAGKRAEAKEVLRAVAGPATASQAPPYFIAAIYAALGEKDRAFHWLDRAYDSRDEELGWIKVDPKFRVLHSDPRFTDLLRRMRLVG
jgi:TolB-like protein/Tfp pilus assembly protein PilF/predicted Ser/Thr protein kinase